MSSGEPLPDLGTIHERLAYARKKADYTQIRLAAELGIGERTLQAYESGETHIPAELVLKVELLVNTPPGWILYDGPLDPDVRAHWLKGVGGTLSVVATTLLLLFPAAANAAADRICECVVIPAARQPRTSLAHRFPRRRTSPRGVRRD